MSLSVCDPWSNHFFQEAIDKGDVALVRSLLTIPIDPAFKNNRAIKVASRKGYVEVVRLLLSDARVDPTSMPEDSLIAWASENGHAEVVRLLLFDGRSNPASLNNTAVWVACLNGHLEVVRLLLLDPRVNPADVQNRALCAASQGNHQKIVELLLTDARVNPTDKENQCLRFAVAFKSLSVVKCLLADPRVYRTCCVTILHENFHLMSPLLIQKWTEVRDDFEYNTYASNYQQCCNAHFPGLTNLVYEYVF